MKKANPPYRHHVAADFVAADGVRHASFQLLNSETRAVAIADFHNGVCFRYFTTPVAKRVADAWFVDLRKVMKDPRSRECAILLAVLAWSSLPVKVVAAADGFEYLAISGDNGVSVFVEVTHRRIKTFRYKGRFSRRVAVHMARNVPGDQFSASAVLRVVDEAKSVLGSPKLDLKIPWGSEDPFPIDLWHFEKAAGETELDYEAWREDRIEDAVDNKFAALMAE